MLLYSAVWLAAAPCLAGIIFWSQSNRTIHRANADGSERTMIVADTGENVNDLALDEVNRKIYWTSTLPTVPQLGRIHRANWDGTNQQVLLLIGNGPGISSAPRGIDVDVAGGKIYWSEGVFGNSGYVRRANLDATGMETLLLDSLPTSMAVDHQRGTFYYNSQSRIDRWALNGTGGVTVLQPNLNVRGIDIDEPNGLLYFIDAGFGDGIRVMRSTVDGDNETVLQNFLPTMRGLEYDSSTNTLLLVNGTASKIQRMTLNGQFSDVITSTPGIAGIAFTAVPEPSTIVMACIAGVLLLCRTRRGGHAIGQR